MAKKKKTSPSTVKKPGKTAAGNRPVTPQAWTGFPHVEPQGRAAWRAWLIANHERERRVWVVYRKKTSGSRSLPYDDAVEEALCFGWIDTTVHPVDEHRYKQMFTPRKEKSLWSGLNKRRVEKLLAAGLMHAAGLAKIESAKRDGSWTAMDALESLTVPPDFKKALAANPQAKKNFNAFSPSVKKTYLRRLNSAKRPETRAKRLAEVMKMVEANVRRFM